MLWACHFTHTGTGETFYGQRQPSVVFPYAVQTLVWLWVISFAFAMKPTPANAVRQKNLPKEAPKAKTTAPTPPIRKLSKTQNETTAPKMPRKTVSMLFSEQKWVIPCWSY